MFQKISPTVFEKLYIKHFKKTYSHEAIAHFIHSNPLNWTQAGSSGFQEKLNDSFKHRFKYCAPKIKYLPQSRVEYQTV